MTQIMNVFENKKAFVLGGSGGIGFEVARVLLKNGADLILHGRNKENTDSALKRLKSEFPEKKIKSVLFDFDKEKFENLEQSRVFEEVKKTDILCVCYGPFLQKNLDTTSLQDWQKTALLDYALPGSLVSVALPNMKKNNFGRILLFGGTGTNFRNEFFTNAAYAGAKTGIGIIVQSVAAEFADFGITCNAILPGFVETQYISSELCELLKKKMPGNRLISLESIAKSADFLLTKPDLNGVLLKVDRGWSVNKNYAGL